MASEAYLDLDIAQLAQKMLEMQEIIEMGRCLHQQYLLLSQQEPQIQEMLQTIHKNNTHLCQEYLHLQNQFMKLKPVNQQLRSMLFFEVSKLGSDKEKISNRRESTTFSETLSINPNL